MINDSTRCPNCGAKNSVAEYDNFFQCTECACWGYSPRNLAYSHEQPEFWHQDGQVCRKPRAA